MPLTATSTFDHAKLAVVVVVALIDLAPRPLHSQSATLDPSASARARFESGLTHYNLTEYREALIDFVEAYRIKRDPVFLFNIGQCHRQLGDSEKAAQFYRTYLREMPGARNRADVEKLIADADRAAAERRAQVQPTAVQAPRLEPAPAKAAAAPIVRVPRLEPTPPRPEAKAVTSPGLIPSTPAEPTATATTQAGTDAAPKRSRAWLWIGIGVAAAVVAGVGAGLGFGLSRPHEPPSELGTFTAVFQ